MRGQDILIVEDENIVALDMRMRLESMGYRVVDVVDTAALALEKAVELSPELVLMDIKLKGNQDGIEAATRLSELSEVPVIFVTAFTDDRTLDRAKRASPYGYIVKPFHERELRIAIELAIYKHQYELSIRRAKEIAEEANRVKGDFLANMSHELKTPLNSIIGFSELAMAASMDREQKEYLAFVLSAAKSLLTMIDSILNFARMEAGKLLALSLPFSLDEILNECADSLAIGAFPKGLEVSMRRDPAIPDSLIGDGSLLRHILLNLLDNAVKFTDKGRVRITASLDDRIGGTAGRRTLRFEVSDTGIGMAKDKIALAFDRFSQLDPSRTRKAGGTGLGLAIVAKSVELMGGEISVESEPGRGTRFTLNLPFDSASDENAEADEAMAASMREVSLVGFEGEGFSDAALALSRLGYSALMTDSLEAAAARPQGFVLADESRFKEIDGGLVDSLKSRLVIATRLGGDIRSRLGWGGISFSPLPLRSSGLRLAFSALADPSSQSRGLPGSTRPAGGVSREREGVLERLAAVLEKAVTESAFADAEREAKIAQASLIEDGDSEGSRLAFAALLSARKGDIDAIRATTARMRDSRKGEDL